jgi:hypothetical protein
MRYSPTTERELSSSAELEEPYGLVNVAVLGVELLEN